MKTVCSYHVLRYFFYLLASLIHFYSQKMSFFTSVSRLFYHNFIFFLSLFGHGKSVGPRKKKLQNSTAFCCQTAGS